MPTRRSETAAALADDLRRFLAGEPVHAAPPTAAYRLGKFASRNRGLLAVVSSFASYAESCRSSVAQLSSARP